MYYISSYQTIKEFIYDLKTNENVIGIVEYGRRKYSDMKNGGDYDLTVFHNNPCIQNISGLHFRIGTIPIDCMIKTIEFFNLEHPENEFDSVHLNCDIIFDRNGSIAKGIEKIKEKWSTSNQLTEGERNNFRFSFRHTVDKLKYRLKDDLLYSHFYITSSMDWFIECYAKIYHLDIGKPQKVFSYIENTDPRLYELINSFFTQNDIEIKYKMLSECAEIMLKDIGGFWADDELIFHVNGESCDQEKNILLNLLNLK